MKDLGKVINGMIDRKIQEIHTSLPAKIIRVDGLTVDVQPLVNVFRTGVHRKLPVIHQVPFRTPQVKRCGIRWNPEIGDKVMLMVSEVSIDNLLESKIDDVVNSEDGRCFDLSDAVAIPNFQTEDESEPLSRENGIQIHYDKQTITIKKNGDIEIGDGSITQNLATETFVTEVIAAIVALGGTLPTNPLHTTSKTKAE